MKKKCFVFDTNVYLSALIFGGNSRRVLEIALFDGHTIIVSEEIYSEMLKVISRKFPKFLKEYRVLEAVLRENTIQVQLGSISVAVCRDPKDNMILETALIGRAGVIVTGDEDLLSLKSYEGIRIVTPSQALREGFLS